MARAPTTASAASTQKSIESMHSSLSLAVGYNKVVTHCRRSCNNVVAILAGIRVPAAAKLGVGPQPLYCPWPRCFRCIPHSSLLARPSLCALSALRGTSADATMTTPGGASTLPPLENILELLQSSAHRLLS